jgi:alpha-beta hydrolase superfamily lysophospholipase
LPAGAGRRIVRADDIGRSRAAVPARKGRGAMQSSTFAIVRDGAAIFVRRWAPDSPPRAAVQIAHGLAEHSARYERVAAALTATGYAVYASDHRGHGPACAPADLGFFADENGWRKCLEDLWAVNRRIAADLPRAPIVFMGHSLGSIMGQQFIAEHGGDLAGAVLSGTSGQPPAILPLGRLLARFERWRLGPRGHSAILRKMLFEDFNKPFKPARTDFDWLSRDPAEVDKYIADPLCGFPFTTQLAVDLLDALGPIASKETIARIPKTLAIYIFSGARDPLGANLQSLVKAYAGAGLTKVTTRIYPGARHETLNETNRNEVVAQLIGWLRTVGS